MKPEEYDVVRLLTALPESDLPAGSIGAVVMDHAQHTDATLPRAYEVEFADVDGITQAVVTVEEVDLEVV